MQRSELVSLIGSGLFANPEDDISIRLDQLSAGPVAMAKVAQAYDGFDWEQGHFILVPETPLVSWEYLERIHPGIKEMIEEERVAYEKRPRRVIVAGNRNFGQTDEERALMRSHMESLCCPPYVTADKVEVVSGCARGVDTAGADLARELGYGVKEFPADWESYGKSAGFIRNAQMADYASEDDHRWKGVLLAFWDGESKGTADMIRQAEKKGLSVKVVRIDKTR